MFSRKSPCESRKRGKRGKRWGTLERVPQTPQNFSRINLLLGRRSCRFQGKCHPKQSLHRDKPVPRRFRPGCRGRSPRQNKLKISPFPVGEGGRGIGGKSKTKGTPRRRGRGKPPTAHGARPYPCAARVQQEMPLKQSLPRNKPVPRRFRPGCRGRSPRQSKLKISPFPGGEGGGGIGGRKAN